MAKLDRLGWADGVVFNAYGTRFGVRFTDSSVRERVIERLPFGCRLSPLRHVSELYSFVVAREKRGRVKPFHLIYRGAGRIARSRDLDEVLDKLAKDLELRVAGKARTRLFVHAGVVRWRGRAILFPGSTLAGKTTLVRALAEAGATYYSDEYAILDENGRVHPYSRPLGVRERVGRPTVPVSAESLGFKVGVVAIPVGAVVACKYLPEAGSHLVPVGPGRAVLELLAHTVRARVQPDQVVEQLSRAVRQARAWSGIRGEAKELVSWLLARLDGKEGPDLSPEVENVERRGSLPYH